VEILVERPDWQLFRDGCPCGELPQQVATRLIVWSAACAQWWGTLCFFQWAFSESVGHTLAWNRTRQRQITHFKYGEPERTEL
jgi:hypothetical protein